MYYHQEGIKGFIIVCIIAVTMLIIFLIAGCATRYHVEITKPDGTHVLATSESYREFALFQLAYDPTVNLFTVTAVGVTDDTAEVVGQAVGVVGTIAETAAKAYLGPVGFINGTETKN